MSASSLTGDKHRSQPLQQQRRVRQKFFHDGRGKRDEFSSKQQAFANEIDEIRDIFINSSNNNNDIGHGKENLKPFVKDKACEVQARGSKLKDAITTNQSSARGFERRDKGRRDFPIVYLPAASAPGRQSNRSLGQQQFAPTGTNRSYYSKTSSPASPLACPADREPSYSTSTSGSSRSTFCDSNSSSGGSSGFLSTSEHKAPSSASNNSIPPATQTNRYRPTTNSSGHSTASRHKPLSSRLKHLGLKSKVIDDLDRLLFEASRCSGSASPANSYFSSATSTLARSHEFDHSTLCRDEFSSFIVTTDGRLEEETDVKPTKATPFKAKQETSSDEEVFESGAQKLDARYTNQAGPTLVGVHEINLDKGRAFESFESSPEMLMSSRESSIADEGDYITQEIASRSQSECSVESSNRNSSAQHLSSDDNELIILEYEDQSNASSLVSDANSLHSIENEASFEIAIDSYMSRIERLLNLSGRTGRVSLNRARCDKKNLVKNNSVAKVMPSSNLAMTVPERKVVQEITMIDDFNCEDSEEFATSVELRTVSDHFATELSSGPQNFSDFSWTEDKMGANSLSNVHPSLHELETSLLAKFIDEDGKNFKTIGARVECQISEFLERYKCYQRELATNTTFSNDWHENWSFAYKRRIDRVSPGEADDDEQTGFKRARVEAPIDLIKYSTLLLVKFKPIRLTYVEESDRKVDEIYGAQEEKSAELEQSYLKSRGQIDVCHLLLSDLFDESRADQESAKNKRPLVVKYCNSSLLGQKGGKIAFSAGGYFFECPSLVDHNNRAFQKRLQAALLSELSRRLLSAEKNFSTVDQTQNPNDPTGRVGFTVGLGNLELSRQLPVIQFCARIVGLLPIRVRWFREDKEISETRGQAIVSKSGDSNQPSDVQTNWPLEMQANYDYEYQNRASKTRFRFRRNQDEIMFELRDANLDLDYNKNYKCVIENFCSKAECNFTLKMRPKTETDRKPAVGAKCKEPNRSAILRTWSQRTLHKLQPRELRSIGQAEVELDKCKEKSLQSIATANSGSSGRLSSMARDDKFGKNFPYHPENLLKRLEENKFSALTFKTLKRVSGGSQEEPSNKGCSLLTRSNIDEPAFEMKFTDTFHLSVGDSYGGVQDNNDNRNANDDQRRPADGLLAGENYGQCQPDWTCDAAVLPKPRKSKSSKVQLQVNGQLTRLSEFKEPVGHEPLDVKSSSNNYHQTMDGDKTNERVEKVGGDHQLEGRPNGRVASEGGQSQVKQSPVRANVRSLISKFNSS